MIRRSLGKRVHCVYYRRSVKIMLCLLWIVHFQLVASISLKASSQFNSIDPWTINKYTDIWKSNHKSWISIDSNEDYCNPLKSWTSFPVCSGDFVIEEDNLYNSPQSLQCRRAQCIELEDNCGVTPRDTIDYLPPAPVDSLDTDTICASSSFNQVVSNYSLGLDQGIPPDFTPIAPIGLVISGNVYAQFNGKCEIVPNAEIVAWHVDTEKLSLLDTIANRNYRTNQTLNQGDANAPYSNILNQRPESLRSLSCRGQQHTDTSGHYSFRTTMPPTYGPPRHIMVTITAPGFQSITTRVYFDYDWRLQQLTTAGGNVHSRTTYSPPQAHGFATDHNDLSSTGIYPGQISKDPRVSKLKFRHEPLPDAVATLIGASNVPGLAYGHFEVTQNFYLGSLRALSKNNDQSSIPPFDLQGLWSDNQGGLIAVETHGNVFLAREVPHPRTWHVLWGYLVGNSIRGVHFSNHLNSLNDDYDVFDPTGGKESLEDVTVLITERIQHAGFATGVIIPTDPFQSNSFSSTNPQAMTIDWTGRDFLENKLSWSKQSDRMSNVSGNRYRYLRLMVLRTSGLETDRLHAQSSPPKQDPGQLIINEIEFFESILANEVRPRYGEKMQSARFPSPYVVTCSSFQDQNHHCYKAFDGDTSSKSSWVTSRVGIRRNVLSEPQWVLFDFGEGRAIQPTALRIVCDAANTMDANDDIVHSFLGENKITTKGSNGCPMTFMLQGSHDNVKFDTLYRTDLYDFAKNGSYLAEYPNGGRLFYFPYDSLHGRGNGQRCGSCDMAPAFTCQRDSFDVTCDSRYCGQDGLCASLPKCPAGEYLSVFLPEAVTTSSSSTLSLYKSQIFRCLACPAGRYGATSGLRSLVCSGTCAPGFFCPAGSVSQTENPCHSYSLEHPYSVYCPEGSGSPLQSPSGQRTVLEPAQDRIVPCEAGAYCIRGVQYPCPVGRYGARGSLAQAECTAPCPVGYYCSQTTDNPWINLHQNLSDMAFLQSRENYHGVGNVNPVVCPKGYYCPDGRYKVACPAGRFGAETGLRDAFCSGPCEEGYFCPEASVSSNEIPCPAGRYGNVIGLKDANCAGPCPEGYFCPLGTNNPLSHPCGGPHLYCSEGSSFPTLVTPGYYTAPGEGGVHYLNQTHQRPAEPGFYAQYGRRFACPAGTFGQTVGLNADQESQGRAPPSRAPSMMPSALPSRRPTRIPTAIPTATSAPTFTYSPTISFSPTVDPSIAPTLTPTFAPTASPTLEPTYAPSVMPTQPTYSPTVAPSALPSSRPSSAPTATFRPSATPTLLPTAIPTLIFVNHLYTHKPSAAPTLTSQAVLTKFLCSGYCAPGYFCPENSTSSKQIPCPSGRYGDRFGLADSYCSGVCPLGHYCPAGTVNPIPCPAGVFGAYLGLTDATCSPVCPFDVTGQLQRQPHDLPVNSLNSLNCDISASRCFPGYYCPLGSVSGKQYVCGSASVFCPPGSASPQVVQPGYYSINREIQRMLTRVETVTQVESRSIFTDEPITIAYSAEEAEDLVKEETTRVAETICEPGHFCKDGKRFACPAGRYGDRYGLTDASCSGPCARGYYCPEGSTDMKQLPCPAGRYGSTLGLSDSACSGVCHAGFHCPSASTSVTELPCATLAIQRLDAESFFAMYDSNGLSPSGDNKYHLIADAFLTRQQTYLSQFNLTVSHRLVTVQSLPPDGLEVMLHLGGLSKDDSPTSDVYTRMEVVYDLDAPNAVYCPSGSARPIPIVPGYYSTGGISTMTRISQELCPAGSYCASDGIKRACPAGRYGNKDGLVSPDCAGACARGYYCPAGSLVSTAMICPIGRYGDREGLTSADCSGPCPHPLDCPPGSITPKPGRNI